MLIAFFIVAAVAVILAVVVVTRPDSFRMERSTLVAAPAAKVFPLINDFRRWTEWSPWEGVEGDELKRTYGDISEGPAAVYEWIGKKTGTGRMEILEAPTPQKVLIKLDFFKPFEAHNTAEFTLVPEGKGTRLTWAMYGPNPFMAKLMSLVFSTEKMVGPQFEQGLAKLKAVAEA